MFYLLIQFLCSSDHNDLVQTTEEPRGDHISLEELDRMLSNLNFSETKKDEHKVSKSDSNYLFLNELFQENEESHYDSNTSKRESKKPYSKYDALDMYDESLYDQINEDELSCSSEEHNCFKLRNCKSINEFLTKLCSVFRKKKQSQTKEQISQKNSDYKPTRCLDIFNDLFEIKPENISKPEEHMNTTPLSDKKFDKTNNFMNKNTVVNPNKNKSGFNKPSKRPQSISFRMLNRPLLPLPQKECSSNNLEEQICDDNYQKYIQLVKYFQDHNHHSIISGFFLDYESDFESKMKKD
ncbi:hypothetical protein TUBRATIS_009630 [Tubulinosema ratisbonensis]|uniref:Uncharacterized protein n=1 Tax=Tubulinosema ratisbonensis TaxID=291195 RepID=A0A437ANF7_9MICR|nr:hypothetical protein TUBRATIS_009630 [Tubulinosema ratisbonensis]